MCGIAGIWNARPPQADALTRVHAMLEAMHHRGPDGRGTLHWPGGAAGMVRLAMVDLSERGQQPMWSPDGKVAILFNGEMVNHVEHRIRLKNAGVVFRSESDTEVVLALYLERGLKFVQAIRGMFALAVLDFRERGLSAPPRLVLARDPFGIKPLYLASNGNGLVFASELKALLRARTVEPRLDREGLTDYLSFGFVLQPRTMLEGVTMLERGTLRVEDPGKAPHEHRFWLMPPASGNGEDLATSAARIREVVETSVRLHAKADVPVGAFLSGGVDSSVVVALMARHNPKLRTYTVRSNDSKADESAQARAFANQLGCTHTEIEVGAAEVLEQFPKFAAGIDQPSTDGFNIWLVSRAAAQGVKGVVSGLGGDEWFAGYPVARRMAGVATRPAQQLLGRGAGKLRSLLGSSRVTDQLVRVASRKNGLSTWAAAHRVFLPHALVELGCDGPVDGAARLLGGLAGRLTDADPVDLACQLDVWGYMGCQLLRDSDVTSMASSLELRVPFVDVEVASAARALPASHKLGGALPIGKRVLIEAFRDLLPADMAQRPKRGFALPCAEWLAGPLKPIADEALYSLRRRGVLRHVPEDLDAVQRWALVLLELWYQALVESTAGVRAA